MKKWTCLATLLIAATFVFTGCSGESKPATTENAQQKAPVTGDNVVNIEASNWKFDQEKYEAKAGSPITINFKSAQGVHGLTIDGTDINIEREGTATFTPDKPGEYKIFCSVACGTKHGEMMATLVVK